jgi:hypothetical protein
MKTDIVETAPHMGVATSGDAPAGQGDGMGETCRAMAARPAAGTIH